MVVEPYGCAVMPTDLHRKWKGNKRVGLLECVFVFFLECQKSQPNTVFLHFKRKSPNVIINCQQDVDSIYVLSMIVQNRLTYKKLSVRCSFTLFREHTTFLIHTYMHSYNSLFMAWIIQLISYENLHADPSVWSYALCMYITCNSSPVVPVGALSKRWLSLLSYAVIRSHTNR